MARYSQIDPIHYPQIIGAKRVDAVARAEKAIRKTAETIQTSWFGASSWAQKYIEGEVCWFNYKVFIDNMHRRIKMLKLIPAGETEANRTLRRDLRRAYKKAL